LRMPVESIGPLKIGVEIEAWPLAFPLRIAGYTFTSLDVLLVTLERAAIPVAVRRSAFTIEMRVQLR